MPVFFIMCHSVIYEMIEWVAAIIVAPELGDAYLGTQGDGWDAQKDMALAAAGAAIAMCVLRLRQCWLPRSAEYPVRSPRWSLDRSPTDH